MIKQLTMVVLVLALFGCNSTKVIEKVVYKDKLVPVTVVPAPEKVNKPILLIDQLSIEQKNDLGELSKAYVISIEQLEEYSKQLSLVINKYDEMSKNNPK